MHALCHHIQLAASVELGLGLGLGLVLSLFPFPAEPNGECFPAQVH